MKNSITPTKNAIIVSDLHLGSRYFLHRKFERFLCSIPDDHELILNGDVIDNPRRKLQLPHQRILNLIEQISYHKRVVWIRGNHDNGYIPAGLEKVDFKRTYNIERNLLIAHGDDFDDIMPRNLAFIKIFNLLHSLRLKLGARPVHVANYAKKWKTFYKYLCKNIMMNAVNCAKKNGYKAVTCGHSHYPEYKSYNGIRYINTGAWTEVPTFYLQITDGEIFLNPFVDKSDSKKLSGFPRGRQVLPPQCASGSKQRVYKLNTLM